jgi:hypothetical protein
MDKQRFIEGTTAVFRALEKQVPRIKEFDAKVDGRYPLKRKTVEEFMASSRQTILALLKTVPEDEMQTILDALTLN